MPIIRSWALTKGYAFHPGTSHVAFCTGSSRRWHGWLCARRTSRSSCCATSSQYCTGRACQRLALAEEDRALLGAVAAALSRPQRAGWLVTPETLLRWHRRRIARHWTQPCRAPGRPCTSVDLRRLIIEMATNNPAFRTQCIALLLLASYLSLKLRQVARLPPAFDDPFDSVAS